jgi:hypothetical protein
MTDSDPASRRFRELTVVNVREPPGADHVQVMFSESARVYRLSKQHPAYRQIRNLLQAAQAGGRVLSIGVASPDGDEIEEVRERTSDER